MIKRFPIPLYFLSFLVPLALSAIAITLAAPTLLAQNASNPIIPGTPLPTQYMQNSTRGIPANTVPPSSTQPGSVQPTSSLSTPQGAGNPVYIQPAGTTNFVPGSTIPGGAAPYGTMPTTGIASGTTVGTAPGNGLQGAMSRPIGAMPPTQSGNNTSAVLQPQQPFPPLTNEEQQKLNYFLSLWQQKTNAVASLECKFDQYEYDGSYNLNASNANASKPTYITFGHARYEKNERGIFSIDGEYVTDPKTGKILEDANSRRERYICNGESVFYFNYADKTLTEYPIPEDQRGKGIIDSPLMLIVGANPAEMHNRFFLRLRPTPESSPNTIIFEAWPKWQEDAQSFLYVQVKLKAETFEPTGLISYHTNWDHRTSTGGRTSYGLRDVKVTLDGQKSGILENINLLPNRDEFAKNMILKSINRDWKYEVKEANTVVQNGTAPQTGVGVVPQPANVVPQYGSSANNPMPVVPNTVPTTMMTSPTLQTNGMSNGTHIANGSGFGVNNTSSIQPYYQQPNQAGYGNGSQTGYNQGNQVPVPQPVSPRAILR